MKRKLKLKGTKIMLSPVMKADFAVVVIDIPTVCETKPAAKNTPSNAPFKTDLNFKRLKSLIAGKRKISPEKEKRRKTRVSGDI